ncbi:unnamed protein product [Psylliodes chrysocephalus]|uniref:Uncharacterized protein n=1 Tax=Psylliodes chrysocephalus TaxID=3402493 RepID=A0A9P0D5K9_9CUCU|nr:unnamed protein product [Psylliodes chrysocephala]
MDSAYSLPMTRSKSKRFGNELHANTNEAKFTEPSELEGKKDVSVRQEPNNFFSESNLGNKINSNHEEEVNSIRSVKSKSSHSSIDVERKTRALAIEKARQEIELLEKQNKLKLLEIENDIFETKISDRSSRISSISKQNSVKSFLLCDDENADRTSKWVENISVPQPLTDTPKERDSELLKLLCQSVSEAIKTVADTSKQEKFVARQIVEKDFPAFDGNPEDWPVFIYQFRHISSLCQYSNEERMIKLNKCLRGAARSAVSGMMMSPNNVDFVLKNLERCFGRPDLIIDRMLPKIQAIPTIKENHMECLIQFSNHVRFRFRR